MAADSTFSKKFEKIVLTVTGFEAAITEADELKTDFAKMAQSDPLKAMKIYGDGISEYAAKARFAKIFLDQYKAMDPDTVSAESIEALSSRVLGEIAIILADSLASGGVYNNIRSVITAAEHQAAAWVIRRCQTIIELTAKN